ncbi:MAG: hypothetical protein A2Z20_06095 [Bdellovibrionales bacterium RBG_16_40_8]|nr:MAG: hypothetical protein A2Z20_06095 [Bdellovibrionales bacterium RBG_16_40_8]
MLILLSIKTFGCSGGGASFSLLDDSQIFKQTKNNVNAKVDILWVIDNSGSMESSQQNVIDNLNAFIQDFSAKNLDFKMAVTTTDAYRVEFTGNHNCSKFRDGLLNSNCTTVSGHSYSGIRVIDNNTANLSSVFLTNALLTDTAESIYGSADERAFMSLTSALNEPLNSGFLRSDSFLSVIILSDEDDFSHTKSSLNESYTNSNLYSIQHFVDYLDSLTLSTGANRRYNVNAMAIFDESCRSTLSASGFQRKIGVRYEQFVDEVNADFETAATKGLKTSLCGDFAIDLKNIASNILTLANRFTLNRIPKPETIVVAVNGATIPQKDTNPLGSGGWVFEQSTNSILFIGNNYIPAAGASIYVGFDPVGYGK